MPECCQNILEAIANAMQRLLHEMRPIAVPCLVTALGRRTAGAELHPVLCYAHSLDIYCVQDVQIDLAVTRFLWPTWVLWPQGGDSSAAPKHCTYRSSNFWKPIRSIAVVECVPPSAYHADPSYAVPSCFVRPIHARWSYRLITPPVLSLAPALQSPASSAAEIRSLCLERPQLVRLDRHLQPPGRHQWGC